MKWRGRRGGGVWSGARLVHPGSKLAESIQTMHRALSANLNRTHRWNQLPFPSLVKFSMKFRDHPVFNCNLEYFMQNYKMYPYSD